MSIASKLTNTLEKLLKRCAEYQLCLSHFYLLLLIISLTVFRQLQKYNRKQGASLNHDQQERISKQNKDILDVITPLVAAWPSNYTALFSSFVAKRTPNTISLSGRRLLDHVCAGKIELKDDNIAILFKRDGYTFRPIRLTVDLTWKLRVLQWMLPAQSPSPVKNLWSRPSIGSTVKSQGCKTKELTIDLDYLPYHDLAYSLPKELSAMFRQSRIILVEITTLSPHIGLFSDEFTLCSVPFRPHLANSTFAARTATPLLFSLEKLIKLLSSNAQCYQIASIMDMTEIRIDYLQRIQRHLVFDMDLRNSVMRAAGDAGWREARARVIWETGLLATGNLRRWRVVVRPTHRFPNVGL